MSIQDVEPLLEAFMSNNNDVRQHAEATINAMKETPDALILSLLHVSWQGHAHRGSFTSNRHYHPAKILWSEAYLLCSFGEC